MATNNLIEQLKNQITKFAPDVTVEKVGTVIEVGDGIARISGLTEVKSMEMLDFGQDEAGNTIDRKSVV